MLISSLFLNILQTKSDFITEKHPGSFLM